ncbi:MAG: hypothetical protein GY756_23680, partial [bacterium]|nr:hypothetical protein [bacterium]
MMEKDRWLIICWIEKFDDLDKIELEENNNNEGILLIKPPFCELTLSDGFWDNLNTKFELMLDMAEEEDINYKIIPSIVTEIKTFARI